ncbi:hypothetical protein BpHYR1_019925 [Brachionus plicatilis]|uniref:Uncharacterized protein n=1 Tax=Brachionus plicatilis TaxID=10195 RepID=A0A3M7SXR2_BRAPC|nr:hypothetical protein BpHYR1_019925 [Brachionus plicatilis]
MLVIEEQKNFLSFNFFPKLKKPVAFLVISLVIIEDLQRCKILGCEKNILLCFNLFCSKLHRRKFYEIQSIDENRSTLKCVKIQYSILVTCYSKLSTVFENNKNPLLMTCSQIFSFY